MSLQPNAWSHLLAVRTPLPRWLHVGLACLGFAGCVGLYLWAGARPDNNPTFIPPIERIATAAQTILSGPDFWSDVRASFGRVTAGLLLAVLFAVPFGLWIGAFRPIEALTQPVVEFLRYVPVPALIPIVMIFFGIGEGAKIALIFLGTFFQLALMVAEEVRRVPNDLVHAAQTLGASRGEILSLVLFRGALPGILDAVRLCNGWAWSYVVVAEMIAATEGLGFRVLRFYRFIQTPNIFVYLLVLGLIGLALDQLFRACNARLFRWADATRR